MSALLAELEAEENAAQLKSSKARRKKNKKKGAPKAPLVSDCWSCLSCCAVLLPRLPKSDPKALSAQLEETPCPLRSTRHTPRVS